MLTNYIKNFYFNEWIIKISLFCCIFLNVIYLVIGIKWGLTTLTTIFETIVISILVSSLYYSYIKHKLILMSGIMAAILFFNLHIEANFVLNGLLTIKENEYIAIGPVGGFYLSFSLMLLIIESLICLNHFAQNITKNNGITKLEVNQILILLLLILLIVISIFNCFLNLSINERIFYFVDNISYFTEYLMIGNCELILAIDRLDTLDKENK